MKTINEIFRIILEEFKNSEKICELLKTNEIYWVSVTADFEGLGIKEINISPRWDGKIAYLDVTKKINMEILSEENIDEITDIVPIQMIIKTIHPIKILINETGFYLVKGIYNTILKELTGEETIREALDKMIEKRYDFTDKIETIIEKAKKDKVLILTLITNELLKDFPKTIFNRKRVVANKEFFDETYKIDCEIGCVNDYILNLRPKENKRNFNLKKYEIAVLIDAK
jgi:hypothetical protein